VLRAVEGAIASKYQNTGQTCVCANRIFVQDGVYDAFAAKLAEAVATLTPAPGLEAGATQGPLIDDRAVQKVEEHIGDRCRRARALWPAAGATRLAGVSSSRPSWPRSRRRC